MLAKRLHKIWRDVTRHVQRDHPIRSSKNRTSSQMQQDLSADVETCLILFEKGMEYWNLGKDKHNLQVEVAIIRQAIVSVSIFHELAVRSVQPSIS